MLAKIDDFFVLANYIEAALWTVIGIGFLFHTIFKHGGAPSLVASIAFLLFGISDVIETSTGAWWRPWWLLVLKGTCLAVFPMLLARHLAARRKRSFTPDTAHPKTSTPASP